MSDLKFFFFGLRIEYICGGSFFGCDSELVDMVGANLFHCRKNSWPPEEYISRAALQLVSSVLFCWVMCH